MSEEHCWQTQLVYHRDETNPLLEPILFGSAKIAGIVHHLLAELLSPTLHHALEFIQGETCIFWMLLDVHTPCLQCTPSHLSVECKVSKARVSRKPAIILSYEVFEVVTHCNHMLTRSQKVTCPCGKECRKSTGHVAFRIKLIDRGICSMRPRNSGVIC